MVKLKVNVYISAWGTFRIPEKLFKETQWVVWSSAESWVDDGKRIIITGPKAVPENWRFFKWLHEQEVKEGKPNA